MKQHNAQCVFCAIIAGDAPASVVHRDDRCIAFMNLRPLHIGEFMVIPLVHIDHFTDMPDDLAAHIMVVGQRLGRRMMEVYNPKRVGYVVHGFGVPHAHLNVVPLHESSDIVSAKHIVGTEAGFRIAHDAVPLRCRADLDADAAKLRSDQ
ncbi:HIT family protein [Tateyamaria omphalii]|uniref:HIT family protein n=1 Tax=Tateyamaria omphalii TaxID=299262 RepID=UPI001C99771C|nr:HIT family protein [Tateyamaria omphalii]MBY5932196.1 HIT family protein [Tateyamaria omphalii]